MPSKPTDTIRRILESKRVQLLHVVSLQTAGAASASVELRKVNAALAWLTERETIEEAFAG